jgi:hypothetical protein
MEMDRETKSANEVGALRSLCDEAGPREARQTLMQALSGYNFSEPEHQVVFESIRALFSIGPFSKSQLQIHLNNRGFCDTDVEKYFQPPRTANIEHRLPGEFIP